MKTVIKDILTEQNNETYCAIRILGFIGVGLVGVAIFIGAAPLEVGAGVGAILTSIGGGIRLKGESPKEIDTTL